MDTGLMTLTCENRGILTSVDSIEQYRKEDLNSYDCKSISKNDGLSHYKVKKEQAQLDAHRRYLLEL